LGAEEWKVFHHLREEVLGIHSSAEEGAEGAEGDGEGTASMCLTIS